MIGEYCKEWVIGPDGQRTDLNLFFELKPDDVWNDDSVPPMSSLWPNDDDSCNWE